MKTTFKFENIDQAELFCSRQGIEFTGSLSVAVETDTDEQYDAAKFDADICCEEEL
jgi:hypothetical protein